MFKHKKCLNLKKKLIEGISQEILRNFVYEFFSREILRTSMANNFSLNWMTYISTTFLFIEGIYLLKKAFGAQAHWSSLFKKN
jgi:hypothetical protein